MRAIKILSLAAVVAMAGQAEAQQRIGFIDSDEVLNRIPEYATVQQQIDRMAAEWETEIETRQQEVAEMFREYQARELLYTSDERKNKREEIVRAEEDVERLRMQYFGPEGELFTEQDKLVRPLQERVLMAVEEVATSEGYDYVFDKAGDFLFLFVREQNDLSEKVLEELGIDTEGAQRGR